MLTTLRDLLRYNIEFRIGAILVGMVGGHGRSVIGVALFADRHLRGRARRAAEPRASVRHDLARPGRVLASDVSPFAIRWRSASLSLLISRILSLTIGLLSGYKGGWVDRVLMSINDTFIVIPLFPILVLFYFVLRDHMSWIALAMIMALLGWAYDARLIRSLALSLKTREFTHTGVFSGMSTREILAARASSLRDADRVRDHHEQHELVDRVGGNPLRARLHGHQFPDHRRHDLLGQPAHRAGGRRVVVDSLPRRLDRHVVHRLVSARRLHERAHRSAQPAAAAGCRRRGMTAATALPLTGGAPRRASRRTPSCRCEELKAYYRTRHFGVEREVRAVDGVTFEVRANEIYGLAGESSSGKSTLIKAIAAAMRPPLEIVGGTVAFIFLPGARGSIRQRAPSSPPFAGASFPTSCKAP